MTLHRRTRAILAGALGATTALGIGLAATTAANPASAAPAAPRTAAVLAEGAPGAVKDSYIVVLRPAASGSTVAAAAGNLTRRYGGAVRHAYARAVRGFSARLTASAARRLAADPAVEYVEQDRIVTLSGTQASAPWGLDRLDQRALPLSGSYKYAATAANVTAYILDTGIRTTHADFGGRARSGRDFIDNDGVANDCNGHGTHVAGTVGGTKYGVAKQVKLVGVRVLNCSGSGSYSQIIAGVDWVTANAVKPAVANMSLGGTASKALDDAVRRSIAAGVTYVLAAGNDKVDACTVSPARTPQAITVGATDNADRRASFSNHGTCLDIFAPGVKITSSAYSGDTATTSMSGTSMAAPHVAGAAALVLAGNPAATPAQVRDALVATATAGKVTNAASGSPNRLLHTGVTATVPSPEPTPTASPTPTAEPTPTASPTPTATPTAAPTPTASPTPTAAPTPTATPTTSPTAAPCAATQTANVKTASLKTVTSSLTIGCSGRASATSSVTVDIKHPRRGSLVIDLVTPTGKKLRLKNFSADTADNLRATYRVNASGYARKGVWKLKVWDMSGGSAGYLDAWSLRL